MIETPVNSHEPAISGHREMPTDLLTVAMYKAAWRLALLIGLHSVLEMLLLDEIEQLNYCKFL